MSRQINSSLTSFFQTESYGGGSPGFLAQLSSLLGGGRPNRHRPEARTDDRRHVDALDLLQREIDRIRLQSRHWLM